VISTGSATGAYSAVTESPTPSFALMDVDGGKVRVRLVFGGKKGARRVAGTHAVQCALAAARCGCVHFLLTWQVSLGRPAGCLIVQCCLLCLHPTP
jgi:hypothetical protein